MRTNSFFEIVSKNYFDAALAEIIIFLLFSEVIKLWGLYSNETKQFLQLIALDDVGQVESVEFWITNLFPRKPKKMYSNNFFKSNIIIIINNIRNLP